MGEARNVLEEQSFFVYPPCSLMFAYFQYWKAKQRTTDKEKRALSNTKTLQQLLRSLRVSYSLIYQTQYIYNNLYFAIKKIEGYSKNVEFQLLSVTTMKNYSSFDCSISEEFP